MFYSFELLAPKTGRFGYIWTAATCGTHQLDKRLLNEIVLYPICRDLFNYITKKKDIKLSLYLSSQLLFGVVRIYNRKLQILLADVSEISIKCSRTFNLSVMKSDINEKKQTKNKKRTSCQITDLELIEQNLIVEENLNAALDETLMIRNQARPQDITLNEEIPPPLFADENLMDAAQGALHLQQQNEEEEFGQMNVEQFLYLMRNPDRDPTSNDARVEQFSELKRDRTAFESDFIDSIGGGEQVRDGEDITMQTETNAEKRLRLETDGEAAVATTAMIPIQQDDAIAIDASMPHPAEVPIVAVDDAIPAAAIVSNQQSIEVAAASSTAAVINTTITATAGQRRRREVNPAERNSVAVAPSPRLLRNLVDRVTRMPIQVLYNRINAAADWQFNPNQLIVRPCDVAIGLDETERPIWMAQSAQSMLAHPQLSSCVIGLRSNNNNNNGNCIGDDDVMEDPDPEMTAALQSRRRKRTPLFAEQVEDERGDERDGGVRASDGVAMGTSFDFSIGGGGAQSGAQLKESFEQSFEIARRGTQTGVGGGALSRGGAEISQPNLLRDLPERSEMEEAMIAPPEDVRDGAAARDEREEARDAKQIQVGEGEKEAVEASEMQQLEMEPPPPLQEVEVALRQSHEESLLVELNSSQKAEGFLREAFDLESRMTFRQLCPPSRISKKNTAKVFSKLLVLCKSKEFRIEQSEPYADIFISKV